MVEIKARDEAGDIYYKMLNRLIRQEIARGEKKIYLSEVCGQRYIAAGLSGSEVTIHVDGTPGQDLAAFLDGPTIIVKGNGQDCIANTANRGTVIIHGSTGDLTNHSARGVRTFVLYDIGHRAGVHMKEYRENVPWLVAGGRARDFLCEDQAGGVGVILDLYGDGVKSPIGRSVAAGIHGGQLFIRGKVEEWQFGVGMKIVDPDSRDYDLLQMIITEFCRYFCLTRGVEEIMNERPFVKVIPISHRPFAKLYTAAYAIGGGKSRHQNLTPPCAFYCPTDIPTPVILNLIREDNVEEALRLLDEYTPFRLSCCGTVCEQLCMTECSRKQVDGSHIDIQGIAQKYHPFGPPQLIEGFKEEQVAVIGSGPAGLSAAFQLARRGYPVTVFEATSQIGGKMRIIPADRLPSKTLEYDINRIRSLDIKFKTDTSVDIDFFRDIYDTHCAVVIATGAHKSRKLDFQGSDQAVQGLDFLKNISRGQPLEVRGKRIIIVGAGNVGMDIACECWRLKAQTVTAVDIQKPASFGEERRRAEQEGTKIVWPRTVVSFSPWKRQVRFQGGKLLVADMLIIAIGEKPDYRDFLPSDILLNGDGRLEIFKDSFQTTDPKVYVIGDAISLGLITHSIGMGRLAALEIHAHLQGHEFIFPQKELVPKSWIKLLYFEGKEKKSEVDRCLSCGTCLYCDKCVERCPNEALTRREQEFTIDEDRCSGCGTCQAACPRGAVTVIR